MLALNLADTAEQTETPREALRAALVKLKAAVAAKQKTARALEKGETLHAEALRRSANYDGLDAEITRHKMAGAKSFAETGQRPSVELPPGLQVRGRERAEARDQVTACSAVVAELAAEDRAAEKVCEDAQAGVYDAASVIIAAEAERIAVRRQAAQAEVWACDEQLAAASTNWVRGVDRPRPVRLTPKTLAIMNAGNVPVLQSRPVAGKRQQEVNARWRSFFERLCVDADAQLE